MRKNAGRDEAGDVAAETRDLADAGGEVGSLAAGFAKVADSYAMEWRLRPVAARKRVVLMVSKFDHCLSDLLYRLRIGELEMDVVGIISNHPIEALTASLGDNPALGDLIAFRQSKAEAAF